MDFDMNSWFLNELAMVKGSIKGGHKEFKEHVANRAKLMNLSDPVKGFKQHVTRLKEGMPYLYGGRSHFTPAIKAAPKPAKITESVPSVFDLSKRSKLWYALPQPTAAELAEQRRHRPHWSTKKWSRHKEWSCHKEPMEKEPDLDDETTIINCFGDRVPKVALPELDSSQEAPPEADLIDLSGQETPYWDEAEVAPSEPVSLHAQEWTPHWERRSPALSTTGKDTDSRRPSHVMSDSTASSSSSGQRASTSSHGMSSQRPSLVTLHDGSPSSSRLSSQRPSASSLLSSSLTEAELGSFLCETEQLSPEDNWWDFASSSSYAGEVWTAEGRVPVRVFTDHPLHTSPDALVSLIRHHTYIHTHIHSFKPTLSWYAHLDGLVNYSLIRYHPKIKII